MKISNLTNARYLIVAALASANLVLFQNCSNYSGRVALEGMKDMSSIKEGTSSNIDTAGAGVSMGDPNVSTGTTSGNGQQDNGSPAISTVETVNPNGTTSMMNGATGGITHGDNVLISLDDPSHINDVDNDSSHNSGNNSSGMGSGSSGGNTSNGGHDGSVAGIILSDGNHNNGHHDDDDDVADSDDDHHGEDSGSSKDHGSLCSLHSMIDEDPNLPHGLNDKKIIFLTSADANKSLSFGSGPTSSGKIYIVYTGSETLHLTSLDYKGGRITICGNIKIDSLTSNGKVKLIFAQALSVEVNGNLSTSKLELSGSLVSEIGVDKKAGRDVKKCHIDNNFNIISDL